MRIYNYSTRKIVLIELPEIIKWLSWYLIFDIGKGWIRYNINYGLIYPKFFFNYFIRYSWKLSVTCQRKLQ